MMPVRCTYWLVIVTTEMELFTQDHAKAIELYTRAAEFGSSILHQNLGDLYHNGGNMKKAKFYYEAAAMAGQEVGKIQPHQRGIILQCIN